MTSTVEVQLWVALLVAGFAIIALVSHLLLPSVRWFLRSRANRVLDEVRERFSIEIRPFQLTRRQSMVDRLVYDPKVVKTAVAWAEAEGAPREVAMEKVERYAREIVPSFNAYFYFRVGYGLARWAARLLYRVRLGWADTESHREVAPNSSVVFVINHRSNMDYVLVAYLAAARTALSYAVGEWARVWPLESLLKSMGAYFVRRRSRNDLYRKVLRRYVELATEAGVPQAMFPEGGLTRDGALRPAKLGLLDYMVGGFDPNGERDLVFVPVAVNYDRVLEDRTLIRDLDKSAQARSTLFAVRKALGFVAKQVGLMLRGRWFRYGYACLNFGTPISMRAWHEATGVDFRTLPAEERFEHVGDLGETLMAAIGELVPVLPVPIVASIFVDDPERPRDLLDIKAEVEIAVRRLEAANAKVYLPRDDRDYAVTVGVRMLVLRRLILEEDGLYRAAPDELALLRYYASSISHLDPGPAILDDEDAGA